MAMSLLAATIVALTLALAPAAIADTTRSTNWAGYAVHRAGVTFHRVSATWVEPGATCVGGRRTYSAMWVGLGGYNPSATALEQIGTETDCNQAGQVVSSAWYELVPAPSKTISFPVAPGDVLHASVTVTGHRVVLELDNTTQNRTFRRTLHAGSIDVSSAEWIVEAPSECLGQFACQALPLANFGSVSFSSATVASSAGLSGSIVSGHWGRTKINLMPGGQRFVVSHGGTSDTIGTASPSTLSAGGTSFGVTYATAAAQSAQTFGRRAPRIRSASVRH